MKNIALLMLVTFLAIGATATARADVRATEFLATIDRPVHTEIHPAKKHSDGSVVMNGMTRGELDRHPNGG